MPASSEYRLKVNPIRATKVSGPPPSSGRSPIRRSTSCQIRSRPEPKDASAGHGAVRETRPPSLLKRGCNTQRPALPRRRPERRRTVPGTAGAGTVPVPPARCVPPKGPLPPWPRPGPAIPNSPARRPGAAGSARPPPEALRPQSQRSTPAASSQGPAPGPGTIGRNRQHNGSGKAHKS